MKVLVTGGAGVLGSHICHLLADVGHDVAVVDIVHQGDAWRLADLEVEYHRQHIQDLRGLWGADVVVHCAAATSYPTCWESPEHSMQLTLSGQQNLIQHCIESEAVLMQISTHSVYGKPEYQPIDEAHPLKPTSSYGAFKAAQELLCHAWKSKGLRYVTFRSTTMFGAYDRPGQTVYELTRKVLNREYITITGDGEQSRDFSHFLNLAWAIRQFIASLGGSAVFGETYNIGSGEQISLNRLVETIGDVVRVPEHIKYTEPRPGEEGKLEVDITKAFAELGYEPVVPFEQGVRSMARWIKDPSSDEWNLLSKMREETLPMS